MDFRNQIKINSSNEKYQQIANNVNKTLLNMHLSLDTILLYLEKFQKNTYAFFRGTQNNSSFKGKTFYPIPLLRHYALVANAEQHIQVAGRKVTAVDTNGAGDAFAGAFLYALNSGEDIQTAAELAILISSEVVSQFGPRLDVQDYAKLQATLKKEAV